MHYIDERKFRETKINGLVLKTWPLYEDILSADKVIRSDSFFCFSSSSFFRRNRKGWKNWAILSGYSSISIRSS
jgi:hypothetical protein